MKTLLKLQSAYSPGGIFMFLLNEHTLCFVIVRLPGRAGLVAATLSSKAEVSAEQTSPIQQTARTCSPVPLIPMIFGPGDERVPGSHTKLFLSFFGVKLGGNALLGSCVHTVPICLREQQVLISTGEGAAGWTRVTSSRGHRAVLHLQKSNSSGTAPIPKRAPLGREAWSKEAPGDP